MSMDGYTIAIISILILAIQALGVHTMFTLHITGEKLRETVASQGQELIRLQQQVDALLHQPVDPRNDSPITTAKDEDETLEALIARYEQDEAESWQLLNQSTADESCAHLTIN